MGTVFDTLAEDYQRYRHNYPAELFSEILKGISRGATALDVACGTGKSSEPLVKAGLNVYGIDLSPKMLRVNEILVGRKILCQSNSLPFPSNEFRLITCAQAFHWMDAEATLAEFQRVMVPAGRLAIYWALLDDETTPYLSERRQLISKFNPNFKPDQARVDNPSTVLRKVFAQTVTHQFSFTRTYSTDELIGFHKSASYFSGAIAPEHIDLATRELRKLTEQHFPNGKISLNYFCPFYLSTKGN